MKIAVNTRFLLSSRLEGIGRFTWEILNRLLAEHPEHEFIFFFDRPFDERFVQAPNVTPIVVFPPARHPILWLIWFEMALPRLLKKHQADVFLSPDNYCSLRTQIPTVLVTHDIAHQHFPEYVPIVSRRFYPYFMPKYNRKADRIVAVSEYTKQDIINEYGISADKIDVACNGIGGDFSPLNNEQKTNVKAQFAAGEDYFFYIGAVHPRKNVHLLIAAFDDFKKETKANTKLLIGGRFAWQTGVVKAAYDNAEHQTDIEFIGYVSDEQLPQLMGAAFALVYPSFFEGFGIPILEAMHSEIPVITSNVSSLPEVAGDAALLVNPSDKTAIKEALLRIFNEPNLREALVANGRLQREKFTWERAAAVVWRNIELAMKCKP